MSGLNCGWELFLLEQWCKIESALHTGTQTVNAVSYASPAYPTNLRFDSFRDPTEFETAK